MLVEKLNLSKNSLSDKVAIISGAGRGIGKELARSLSWLGASVIIAEINDYGKEVEDLINLEGGTALFIKTDISKEEEVKNLEKKIIEKFGKIDILINNAYYCSPPAEIRNLSLEEWDKCYDVNVHGAILLIKTFLPYMIKQNFGIINTVTSAEGMQYIAPYSSTKTALISIGKSLAAELDNTNISVFIFGPGMIDTPGIREIIPKIAPMYEMSQEEFINQGVNPGYEGLMPPEDCAAGWAYLIANAKEYHGQIATPFSPLLKFGLIGQKKDISNLNKSIIEKKNDLIIYIKESISEINEGIKIVNDIVREHKDLGIMARKWVGRTFAKRIGMNMENCLDTTKEIENNIHNLSNLVNNDKIEEIKSIIEKFPWYIDIIGKLENHFNQSINDAKGWFKDPEELKSALDVLTYREKVMNSLKTTLDSIYKLV